MGKKEEAILRFINKIIWKLKKIFKRDFVYLDIDKHYFIKPINHWLYYRKSPNNRFHLKFRTQWFSKAELDLLIAQCDKRYLIKSLIEGKYFLYDCKNGKYAGEWKKTTELVPCLVLRGCGEVTHYVKCGYAVVTLPELIKAYDSVALSESALDTFGEHSLFLGIPLPKWKQQDLRFMVTMWDKMPDSFKVRNVNSYDYDEDYEDYDYDYDFYF